MHLSSWDSKPAPCDSKPKDKTALPKMEYVDWRYGYGFQALDIVMGEEYHNIIIQSLCW